MIGFGTMRIRITGCVNVVAVSLAVVLCPCAASGGLPDGGRIETADLCFAAQQLHARVTHLGGGEDTVDSLFLGWFDRPYARATLAVAVKTTAVMRREARLRELGNGAICDDILRSLLGWTQSALTRVVVPERHAGFRPHRIEIDRDNLLAGTRNPPLLAFLDRATTTRLDPTFGDLDMLAALGMRVYARESRFAGNAAEQTRIVRRASDLGLAVVFVETSAELPPKASSLSGPVVVHPLTLRELVDKPAELRRDTSSDLRTVEATVSPQNGETWVSSLARRAIARGCSLSGRFAVCDWSEPWEYQSMANRLQATSSWMWIDAVEGLSLGIVSGWRDLRDGSVPVCPSVFLDPKTAEAIAHTSLDMLRTWDSLAGFTVHCPVVLLVDNEAIDPKNDNRWAFWARRFFEGLCDRQIAFDIIPYQGAEARLDGGQYKVVFRMTREHASDVQDAVRRVEDSLLNHSTGVSRVTVHEPDGRLAGDVWIRSGKTLTGATCVAVANLSGNRRILGLRGLFETTGVQDVVSGEGMGRPARPFAMDAWQVRVLIPVD